MICYIPIKHCDMMSSGLTCLLYVLWISTLPQQLVASVDTSLEILVSEF